MLPSRLDLNLLRALDRLLATRSVTAAARALDLGQPAMSKQLERLRDVLGDPLLVRRGPGMVLTSRGEQLVPLVGEALRAIDAVLAPAPAFDPAHTRGTFVITCGDESAAVFLGPFMRMLAAEVPGIDVRVRPLSRKLPELLDGQEVDVALVPDLRRVPSVALPDLSRFVLRPFAVERFVVVSRARRRWTLPRYLGARHVVTTPLGESDGSILDRVLAERGLARRVALTVPSFTAAVLAVASTELVATLPAAVAMAVDRTLHRAAPPLPLPVGELQTLMIWHPRNTTDERHRFLRTRLSACAPPGGPRSSTAM